MLFVAVGLCDCLKVCHHKTSDTLRLALYQIINRNWQKYKQGIMPQSQLCTISFLKSNLESEPTLSGFLCHMSIPNFVLSSVKDCPNKELPPH